MTRAGAAAPQKKKKTLGFTHECLLRPIIATHTG
jgi:hypothetical protein